MCSRVSRLEISWAVLASVACILEPRYAALCCAMLCYFQLDLPPGTPKNAEKRPTPGGDMALRRIKTLSGGQKSRVALAIVTYRQFFGGTL